MKYMIAQVALKGEIYPVNVPAVTADNARSVTTTMVAQARKLRICQVSTILRA